VIIEVKISAPDEVRAESRRVSMKPGLTPSSSSLGEWGGGRSGAPRGGGGMDGIEHRALAQARSTYEPESLP